MLSAATPAQAPSTYADEVAAALRVFADIRGFLEIEGRSLGGLGVLNLRYAPRDLADGLPEGALRALVDEYQLSVRIALRADSGPAPHAVPALIVRWRLATVFNASADRHERHQVADGEHDRVAALLRALPAPSLLIEAGPEVVAGWRLVTPETNLPAIAGAMGAAATALGAEAFPDLTTAAIAVGGFVRNWNPVPSPRASVVCIVTARPDLAYELPTLVATLTNLSKETEDVRTNQERRGITGRGPRGRG